MENIYQNAALKHNACGTIVGSLLGASYGFLSGKSILKCALGGAALGLAKSCHSAKKAPMDLTDWQIYQLGKEGVIQPFDASLVEPDSYDVRLGGEFTQIQPDGSVKTITCDEFEIGPGECWLAHTIETFCFPDNIKGLLQGKSSWARLSLFVECAGLFDKGFQGTAVLELHNAGTWGIKLRKGDRIAQMSFHRTLPAVLPYGHKSKNNHYQEQSGSRSSWFAKDRLVKK